MTDTTYRPRPWHRHWWLRNVEPGQLIDPWMGMVKRNHSQLTCTIARIPLNLFLRTCWLVYQWMILPWGLTRFDYMREIRYDYKRPVDHV